jgi:hypothetical protein
MWGLRALLVAGMVPKRQIKNGNTINPSFSTLPCICISAQVLYLGKLNPHDITHSCRGALIAAVVCLTAYVGRARSLACSPRGSALWGVERIASAASLSDSTRHSRYCP